MTNPILARLETLAREGLRPDSLHVRDDGGGSWTARIAFADRLPLGEGTGLVGPYQIAATSPDPLPRGVTMQGWERWPDDVFLLRASREGMEHYVAEVARETGAIDWCRLGDNYLTKPNRWRSNAQS